MTTINVKPRVFKNYLLKIGADNYEKHVSNVTLTPKTTTKTWKGASPGEQHSDTTVDGYECKIDYAQDWETPDSFSIYLLNNEGATVDMEFSPLGAGPKFTATIGIVPGEIGGPIDDYGKASVTLGVKGKPDFAPGVVAP